MNTKMMLAVASGLGIAILSTSAGAQTIAMQDKQIVERAHATSVYLQRLSRIALENVADSRVQQFATTVLYYHRDAMEPIRSIANSKRLTLTNRLNQRRMKNINGYRKLRPAVFTDEYLRLVDQTLNQEIKNLTRYAPMAQDSYVRSWAMRRLRHMQIHRQRAADLRASLPGA